MKYLSLCAIVKNEAPYITEWIKYHFHLGVEHFYIYENESVDATLSILKKLSRQYPITLNLIKGSIAQAKAYKSCIKDHALESRWIAFIDVDEFIVCIKDIKVFLKDYENYPGVVAHWYLFGSNGWTNFESKPVVERFTKRQREVNPHIKSIVDPRRTIESYTPHAFIYTEGLAVDEHFERIKEGNPIPEDGSCDLIQINHYATKSLEECNFRRSQPRADTGTTRNPTEFFATHDRNDVEDFKARNFWQYIHNMEEIRARKTL